MNIVALSCVCKLSDSVVDNSEKKKKKTFEVFA